ncbi:MAG: hypothetical protein A2Y97_04830 [Nitrospirae bacterium RBG_13_39_12]|nr:MAG: hypothetical protein A2Y97_04830 [Nitrospirae bacterium RBG_13_39_12]
MNHIFFKNMDLIHSDLSAAGDTINKCHNNCWSFRLVRSPQRLAEERIFLNAVSPLSSDKKDSGQEPE